MDLTLYQIDAFTDTLFKGNPAAVIPLDSWIDDELMQKIAEENNLAETAFFVQQGNDFQIRWFTPVDEINLCGHATLASAYVLFDVLQHHVSSFSFLSKSGPLHITRKGHLIMMDFPSWKPEKITNYADNLEQILGIEEIVGVYKHRDLLIELNTEQDVLNAKPDFSLMKRVDDMIIITAPGNEVDFVSRFFAPTFGVDEDPVTGSAHSQLIPFWSEKLGKMEMKAKQLSRRGGDLMVSLQGDRVTMGGECVFYMKGSLIV